MVIPFSFSVHGKLFESKAKPGFDKRSGADFRANIDNGKVLQQMPHPDMK
jgi:hypothetical protein